VVSGVPSGATKRERATLARTHSHSLANRKCHRAVSSKQQTNQIEGSESRKRYK